MIDPTTARNAKAHLGRLDDAVPGLVVGLYLIGSPMLDDYYPGHSDLDASDRPGSGAPSEPARSSARARPASWPDLAEPLNDILAARAGRPTALKTPHGQAAVELGRRILAEARPD
jgi:hypothetical protein